MYRYATYFEIFLDISFTVGLILPGINDGIKRNNIFR